MIENLYKTMTWAAIFTVAKLQHLLDAPPSVGHYPLRPQAATFGSTTEKR